MDKLNKDLKETGKTVDKLGDNIDKVNVKTTKKVHEVSNVQNYINSIYSVLRIDTHSFRNRLCNMGNSLRKIDRTVQKIARIIERQAE